MDSVAKILTQTLLSTTLLLNTSPVFSIEPQDNKQGTDVDNTKVNKRDESKQQPTADQQKENSSDREITRKIRRSIVKDKSLSTYAHNIKIITQGGAVTLKGPVRTAEEKKAVEARTRDAEDLRRGGLLAGGVGEDAHDLVALDLVERGELGARALSLCRQAQMLAPNHVAGGEHVHLTAPAVKRRVDRLEREGVIRGYTTVVDSRAFGWHAEAFVDLYCEGHMPGEAIKRAVEPEPGVVSAHTVAGEASALLHVMAEDTQGLESALERIRATEGVTRTVTEVVLSTLFQR